MEVQEYDNDDILEQQLKELENIHVASESIVDDFVNCELENCMKLAGTCRREAQISTFKGKKDQADLETDSPSEKSDSIITPVFVYPSYARQNSKRKGRRYSKVKRQVSEIGNIQNRDKKIDVVRSIIHELQKKLNDNTKWLGEFKEIGSTHCGTDCGDTADLDYIYELHVSEQALEVIQTGKPCSRKLKLDGCDLDPSVEYDNFAEAVEENLPLPKTGSRISGDLLWGGFAHCHFSGLRHCGPAVTLLFKCRSKGVAPFDIPVDITLGYVLNDPDLHQEVAEKLKSFPCDAISNLQYNFQLYLVPVGLENRKWQVTTSVLETKLQSLLPDFVKDAIKNCKKFNDWLANSQDIRQIQDHNVNEARKQLLAAIQSYKERSKNCKSKHPHCNCKGPCDIHRCDQDCCQKHLWALSRCMTITHSLLKKSEDAKKWSESCTKQAISINSTAIKFKALELLNKHLVEYESGDRYLDNDILIEILYKEAVDHFLLNTYNISIVSVAAHAATKKEDLFRLFKSELPKFLQEYIWQQ